jgi:hypothetical protein
VGVLQLRVAKSGRPTGQACGSINAIDLNVSVDYYLDCAETKPHLVKTFTNQLAVSGDGFGDAGDSGSLVMDVKMPSRSGFFLLVAWILQE